MYRVPVTNINEWFTDVDAANEGEAQQAARMKAMGWTDRYGRRINPDPVTGDPLQIFPHQALEEAKPIPTDPHQDSRPDADSLFNPAFVDVPPALKQRCRANRKAVSTGRVEEAWRAGEWRHMPIMPLNGATTIIPAEADFMEALPHLGTARVAYHASENFVCRNYSTMFASIVAAELWVNVMMVCDDEGHHMYSAVPVAAPDGQAVKILIIEPQGDSVVPHTDPGRHYVGAKGLAIVV